MIDVFLDFWSGLLSEATNPQKRVFIGYLASALFIAFLWLFFIEKLKIKDATSLIFSKKIWFSKSSKADFKLLLLNRIILSAGAAAVVTQVTISTFLYECLSSQDFVQPLLFYSTPASLVAGLFTICFFLFDDFSRFFVHRLMHKVPLLWCLHQVHHSAENTKNQHIVIKNWITDAQNDSVTGHPHTTWHMNHLITWLMILKTKNV